MCKCKCRLPIPVDDFLDDNTFEALALTGDEEGAMVGPLLFKEAPESTPEPPASEADVQADTLSQILSVVSHLADKIEVMQQVAVLQSDRLLLHRGQGAIPKAQKVGHQASAPPPDSSMPWLDSLHYNALLSAQASSLVDNLEMDISGNGSTQYSNIGSNSNTNIGSNSIASIGSNSNNNIGSNTKHGWARPGGDNVPKVCTPWPQDFIVGHRRRNRLLYDDLDIYQFIQGCIAMVEQQQDVGIMWLMLSQLGSTMRDASFHGASDLPSTTTMGSAPKVLIIIPMAHNGNTCAAGAGPWITWTENAL
jgi:hypothetical protein